MHNFYKDKKLGKEFYCRDLIKVARELLGKILVKENGKILLAGKIIEVEAYDGDIDEAAHSYKGLTKRTEVMFRRGGYLYVYFTYGVHHCCNVVTGKEGKGTAVLLRAIEPIAGTNKMIKNRFDRKSINKKEFFNLTNGPGKICKSFNISIKHSGLDLTNGEIYLLDQPVIPKSEIGISKRIGITKSVNLPWRFFIKGNPFLSR